MLHPQLSTMHETTGAGKVPDYADAQSFIHCASAPPTDSCERVPGLHITRANELHITVCDLTSSRSYESSAARGDRAAPTGPAGARTTGIRNSLTLAARRGAALEAAK
jgi:hypothetical protein